MSIVCAPKPTFEGLGVAHADSLRMSPTKRLDKWHEAAPACQWNLWPCVEPVGISPKEWIGHDVSENGTSKNQVDEGKR